MKCAVLALAILVMPWTSLCADEGHRPVSRSSEHAASRISGEEHWATRDGLRIYLWEKYAAGSERTFTKTGKVALLVHGGTWSGRGVSKLDLLGWSAGPLRAGLYAMQHSDRVQKLILYAPCWKGSPRYLDRVRKRIENGGNL